MLFGLDEYKISSDKLGPQSWGGALSLHLFLCDIICAAVFSNVNRQYRGRNLNMADQIQVGQEAPDFTLKGTQGGDVTLSQYRGDKNVLLAFYILDFTGG